MKIFCFLIIAILIQSYTSSGQDLRAGVSVTDRASGNTWTPGDPGYTTYREDKNYVVFKLWNESDPLSELEKEELKTLKDQLAKKNIPLVVYQWKSKEDIEKLMKEYGIGDVHVSVENGLLIQSEPMLIHKTVYLKDGNSEQSKIFSFSTDARKAVLVFEGKFPLESPKPVCLCAGKKCEAQFLKLFFKISMIN
ncbi:MAG: hypothetical protein JWN76_2976 [Chitinophagaceae bacterium]|nr:hypothetical protein [Chitinophagaceae bacterium]